MNIDAYCRWLSRFFFAAGHDPDDLYQEARIAAWLCPEHPRLAARRQVLDVVKVANRRSFHSTEYSDVSAADNVVDLVHARERLRSIVAAPRNDREREAVGRALRGEPIAYREKALQNALGQVRHRLRAAS